MRDLNGASVRPRWAPANHDARVRVVALPHAGGSAVVYRPWLDLLPVAADLLPIELPGHLTRRTEPGHRTIDAMADEVAAALTEAPTLPTVIFGMSMGAVVAYEVTQRLVAARTPPAHLIVASSPAPNLWRSSPVDHLDDAALLRRVASLGDEAAAVSFPSSLVRILRDDLAACASYRYRPAPPLPVRITALVADDDPYAAVADVAAWAKHTDQAFDLRIIKGGGHFVVRTRPDLAIDVLTAAPAT